MTKTIDKTIDVGIIYNAFEPTKIERSQLQWRKNVTLGGYLSDLPKECDWKIALNGFPIDLEKDRKKRLKKNDKLILVVVPHGGGGDGGGKTILRTVAMIGLAVAVSFIPGFGQVGGSALLGSALHAGVVAAVTIGGAMLINALIPPSKSTDTATYGYDGAKNTAKPGVAIPIVYGTYRVAGNYIDNFTRLVGQDQYLYGRTVLCDGKATGVANPLINDQTIDNYYYLEVGYGHGYDDYILYDGINTNPSTDANFVNPSFSGINPYFDQNVTQITRGQKIPGGATDWLTYTTTAEVDQFTLNLEFTRGLISYGDTGIKHPSTCNLDAQYSPHGANNWQNIGSSQLITTTITGGTTPPTDKLAVTVQPILSGDGFSVPYSYDIQYKLASDSNWKTFKTVSATSTSRAYTLNNGAYINWSTLTPIESVQYIQMFDEAKYQWAVPLGQYQIRVVGQGTIIDQSYRDAQGGQLTYSYTNQTAQSFRTQISSGMLDRGIYDIRYRKTTGEGNNTYVINELYLIDIAEITNTPVGLTGVTYGWYAVKMTDQFASIPNITFEVQGVAVNKYDVHGNVTATEYSNNPAWIILDMLISEERGSPGIYDIDYPAFFEWAAWCEEKSLKFNGVFDTIGTLWDACQTVLKVGHANFTRVGAKMSVVVDKPTDPVMLFGPGNIFKDSFKVDYVAIDGRANEFEVSYFDETDFNKQKTLRVIDPTPINGGDLPNTASYTLQGVTNFDQAYNEAWYQLYNNRYIRRTVTFDAPIESIGLSIGDIALIQHDMMNWGVSGRIAQGSNPSQAILDKQVQFDDQQWSMLVMFDNLPMGSGNISAIGGYTVTVDNCTNTSITEADVQRLYVPSTNTDVQIIDITYSGTTAYVVVESTTGLTNAPCQFVATDAIEERDIVSTAGESTNAINLASPFSTTPAQYSNYMVGIKTIVKKPYRLKSMSGTGFDARTLTFVEYNENIFLPPGNLLDQPPTAAVVTAIGQVQNLRLSYDTRATDANTSVLAYASWTTPPLGVYGGADIYTSTNGGAYTFYQTVVNTTSFSFYVNQGDTVGVKVVAYNATGARASLATAPYASITVQSGGAYLVPPSGLEVTLISYLALGLVQATWQAGDATPDLTYRVQVLNSGTFAWDEYAVTTELNVRVGDLAAGNHQLRVRSEKGTAYSIWSTASFSVGTTTDTIQPGATNGAPLGSPFGNTTVDQFLQDFEDLQNAGGNPTPPAAPTGLTLISNVSINNGISQTVLTAYWNQNPEDFVVSYSIEFSINGGTYVAYVTTSNTYNINVLPADAVNARIRAISKSGVPSPYAAVVSYTVPGDDVPPAAVTDLTAKASYTSIFLSWINPPDADLKYCRVRYDTVGNPSTAPLVATVNAQPNAAGGYTISGLTSGTMYYFYVEAVDTSGNISPVTGINAAAGYIISSEIIGQLTAAQIASVNAAAIAGQITNTQISDGAISTPKLAAGSVTTATIAAGAVQANNIAANSIVASKLAVVSEGLMPDPLFLDPAWWTSTNNTGYPDGGFTYSAPSGNNWIRTSGDGPNRTGTEYYWLLWDQYFSGTYAQVVCPPIFASPNTVYELSANVWVDSSLGMSFHIQCFDVSNNYIIDVLAEGIGPSQPNTPVKWKFTTAPGTKLIRIYWDVATGSTPYTGTICVSNVNVKQALSATLIVDGTISSAQIQTGGITADSIAAGTITGDKISSSTSLPASLTIGNTGFALSTIQGSLAQAIGQNRVQFSLFENNQFRQNASDPWWIGAWNPNGILTSFGGGGYNGHQLATNAFNATDVNQYTSIEQGYVTDPVTGTQNVKYMPRVTPGEMIWAGAYVAAANCNVRIQLSWHNANGDYVSGYAQDFSTTYFPSDPNGDWEPFKKGYFVQVPAGVYFAHMQFYSVSYGTGNGQFWITQPMLCGVNPGTTIAPKFNPGPTPDAAQVINANTTLITPGKIQLTGGTTLTNWLYGGDNTQINGGAIAANTITANKLQVGNRQFYAQDFNFRIDTGNNRLVWDNGVVFWVGDDGNPQLSYVSAGSADWPNTYLHVYWTKGATTLSTSAGDWTPGVSPNNVEMCVWAGGTTLIVNYGSTIIDGSRITAGSITATQIQAGSITAQQLAVGSLGAITAIIGTLRTATSGGRMEISDNVIKVFDPNNVLRVQLGNLSL